MHNLSISDLNSIQYDEKFTGSVKALRKQAGCARLIKPLRCHHDDDPHFTGRMVNHYKKGVEVSSEQLRAGCCFGTPPEFSELLTRCDYRIIQGESHG